MSSCSLFDGKEKRIIVTLDRIERKISMVYIGVEVQTDKILSKAFNVDRDDKGVVTFTEVAASKVYDNTTAEGNPRRHMTNLTRSVREAIDATGISDTDIEGVGLAHCGVLDIKAGKLIISVGLRIHDVPIVEELKQSVDAPISLYHDVASWALYESTLGVGSGMNLKDFVYVLVSAGIGSTIFHKGKPFSGFKNKAGEFGFMVAKSGEHLQTYASRKGIARRLRDNPGRTTIDAYIDETDDIPMVILNKALENKDNAVKRVMREAAQEIGYCVGSTINLLNPQAIILGGELFSGNDLMYDTCLEVAEGTAMPDLLDDCAILKGQNDHDGIFKGAIINAMPN